jgi:hypothetical protein
MTAIALRVGDFEAPLLACEIELHAVGAAAKFECDHGPLAGRGLVGVDGSIELRAGEVCLFAGRVRTVGRDFDRGAVEITAHGAPPPRPAPEPVSAEPVGPRALDVHGLKIRSGGAPRLRVELQVHALGGMVRNPGGSGCVRPSPRPPQRAAYPLDSAPDWFTYQFRGDVSESACTAPQAAALAKELHARLVSAWLEAEAETDDHDLRPGDVVRVAELGADTPLTISSVRHLLEAGAVTTSFKAAHWPALPQLERGTCVAAPAGAAPAPAKAPEAPAPAPPPISAPLATKWQLERVADMARRGLNPDGTPRGSAPPVAEIAQPQNDTEPVESSIAFGVEHQQPALAGEAN